MTETYIARRSGVAARALGGNVVVMGADSSLYTLNEVASAIWQAADGKTPLSTIVENAVCAQFDVDPEVARRDAESLVQDLSQHGILVVSEQPIGGKE